VADSESVDSSLLDTEAEDSEALDSLVGADSAEPLWLLAEAWMGVERVDAARETLAGAACTK